MSYSFRRLQLPRTWTSSRPLVPHRPPAAFLSLRRHDSALPQATAAQSTSLRPRPPLRTRRHASSSSASPSAPTKDSRSAKPPRSREPPTNRAAPSSVISSRILPSRTSSTIEATYRTPTTPGREIEIQDQVLFGISEQVGGRFGSAVKIVDLGPRAGLQTNKVLGKEMRERFIRGLMTAGVRHVEAGAIIDHRLVPQLEESCDVLIKVANLDSTFHLPMYCPDLAALETLCKAIQYDECDRSEWVKGEILCDEISVMVGCSETYSVATFATTVREHLEAQRKIVKEAVKLGFRVRAHLHCAIECPFEGPVPTLRVADIAQEMVEMGCYEVALGDTTGRGDPRTVRELIEAVGVRVGVEKISGQFHDTFGTGISNVLTALSLGVRTFDTCSAGLATCPYSPDAIALIPTEDVVYTLHNLGYSTGINLIELSKVGAWVSYKVDNRFGTRSRAGKAILARIGWEEHEEIKRIQKERFVSWTEWIKENSVFSICVFLLGAGGLLMYQYKQVMAHPTRIKNSIEKRMAAEAFDKALRRMEEEEEEKYRASKAVV